jgi:hypothetical protein
VTCSPPWYFQGQPLQDIPENALGFVYLIICLSNQKRYIGRKLLKFQRKKKRKRLLVNSDWASYWGSCEELKRDKELLGEENFRREILTFCYSKMQLNYLEAAYQFAYGVLLSDDWYNKLIAVRVRKTSTLNMGGIELSVKTTK